MTIQSQLYFAKGIRFDSYFDPDIFKNEIDQIFYRQWIYAGHISQLPENGSFHTLKIGDKPLVLVRGADSVIRGFYNVCVHRGHQIVEGSGKLSQMTCRYHIWSYDLSGSLRRARGVHDVSALPSESKHLLAIDVEIMKGFIFVRIKRDGTSLSEHFAGAFNDLAIRLSMLEEMKFVKRFTYEVGGNWKFMIENYLECYHCAATHPGLADLFKLKEFDIKYNKYDIKTSAPAGRTDNIAYNFNVDDETQANFSGWWLWPNLTFNVFPGVPNY